MRLIFYRTGAIGDIIHTLPALKFIKEQNPSFRVDLVIRTKPVKELLDLYAPYIDNVYNVGKKLAEEKELLESLKEAPCDEFIYLHSNWWRGLFFNYKYFKAKKFKPYKKDLSLSSRHNFLTAYNPDSKSDLLSSALVLDHKVLDIPEASNEKYLVVVPGVGKLRPQRAYPLKEWMIFIKRVISETDYDVKILGGPDEIDLSLELSLAMKLRSKENTRIENLIGKLSLIDSAKVLAKADKVYSGDTGLLHIASALGKETKSFYTVTSEFRTGPSSPLAEVLRSGSCKCKDLKNFHDNKTKCKYLTVTGLPRCVEELKFSVDQSEKV
ncbi:MAG: glycosyltransferase family 9 protein [Candidatus Caenarcaniphilales bacterium]|nr:glycosyltransferase family 9 protein [Candidatus Caenarcaniphilales bacterium]